MTWDYEGYWNVVLGANRSPGDVIREFDLVAQGLDEWLGHAESEAWSAGGEGGEMPAEWGTFHARALRELGAAVEATEDEDDEDDDE